MIRKKSKGLIALLLILSLLLPSGNSVIASAQEMDTSLSNSSKQETNLQEANLQKVEEVEIDRLSLNDWEEKDRSLLRSDTATMVLSVKDSTGTPLSGVSFSVSGGQYGGSITNVGKSGDDGRLVLDLKPGTYNVIASYQHTKSSIGGIELTSAGNTVEFATYEAKVKVEDSYGNPLDNVGLNYYASSSYPSFGKTGSDGIATRELFAGTYGIQASYRGTRSGYIPVDITQDGIDYTF